MATGDSQPTLESLLSQATDPNNQEDRWDCIQGFYELVNQEADGPQVAIRLLSHKIQSPQEKEALQALTVLEACMNNCGKRFHSEAAKFRFLNELIKVLTPKYFGAWTPQKVKDRVTEVLYGWTLWLKKEPKIQEAYRMLKKQGIVKKDPKLPQTVIMAPPPQRTEDSVFDQEDKATLLARLLKSARPEDLETANRLIKSTIKEEQEKAEKVSKRESTLKEVESSTKQLRDLLEQHTITGTSLGPSGDVKTLYERCDRLRPALFRLASDTMDDDAALAQILAANDELTLAVNAYKEKVGSKECNGGRERSRSEEEMEGITKGWPFFSASSPCRQHLNLVFASAYYCIDDLINDFSPVRSLPHDQQFTGSESTFKAQKQLGEVSGSPVKLEENSRSPQALKNIFVPMETIKPSMFPKLLLLVSTSTSQPFPLCVHCLLDILSEVLLSSCLFVGNLEPITVFDQGGIHVSLHFAKDSPPGHPGVAVVVISTVNTSALHVKDFMFQAAVPKTMLVKLQPASGTNLPPYNPLLPPPAVSQVLILANPQQRKVRLRFKLTLTHGDQQLDETGEIDNFPDWNSLIGHQRI
uniref:ADP-ribosylation factor-binding protein GGA3-like n=1 Tax=Sparus aurata TaxID=8175 RepID=A0A671TNM2_SPAAU